MIPALAHVGAAGAFADRVQVQRAHDPLQFLIIFAAEEADLQPVGTRMRARRRNFAGRRIRKNIERSRHLGALQNSILLQVVNWAEISQWTGSNQGCSQTERTYWKLRFLGILHVVRDDCRSVCALIHLLRRRLNSG